MIKKIRILVILFILSFSFSVKAEVFFELDCDSKNISANKSVTCDGLLVYEIVTINDIEFTYDTNMTTEFKKVDDFDLTKSGNKIKIHANTPLYDEAMFSTVVFQVNLSYNDNLNEKENFTLKNVKINNSNEVDVPGVSESFDITKSAVILDNTNTLETIIIEGKEIIGFDKNKTDYDIQINQEIIYIDAKRTSNKSSVEGLGGIRVGNGEKETREIKVTAENGDINIYKLHITNTNKKINIEDLSKDNTLKTLELYFNKEKIDFSFDKTKEIFDVTVESYVDKITVKSQTNDSKATYANKYGPRDVNLKYGDNKVVIKVYAENSSSKIYVLNIERLEEKDSDNTLKSLIINGKEIVFNDSNNYEIVLAGNTIKTEIEAIANSPKAIVKYDDIILADSNNEVTISVIAENGEENDYRVNIVLEDEKEEKTIETKSLNMDNNPSNTICYSVFGIGIISLIASITRVLIIKSKKTK